MAGRVIGVNTLGIPQSGMTPVQGLFFAIPANHVARIVSELIENGQASYPYIGVEYEPISPDLAAQNDLPVDYGAYVQSTEPGGPADRGGDSCRRHHRRPSGPAHHRADDVSRGAVRSAPGETVPVTVLRGKRNESSRSRWRSVRTMTTDWRQR